MQNNLKKRSTSFGLHHMPMGQFNQQQADSAMQQRLADIDMTYPKQQFPGQMSPGDFVTPRNGGFQVAPTNLSIGQGGLGFVRQKQTQLPQIQVLPIKNINQVSHLNNGQPALAGVTSGTMNNPKNSSGNPAGFVRENSKGHRRQSSSQFRNNNMVLNQFGRPVNGFTAQTSPLNNYPNNQGQQMQSPTNANGGGQQLPMVFSNQHLNVNSNSNIIQSPKLGKF